MPDRSSVPHPRPTPWTTTNYLRLGYAFADCSHEVGGAGVVGGAGIGPWLR